MSATPLLFLVAFIFHARETNAQHPPVTIDWVAHLDYGSQEDSSGFPFSTPRPPAPARIQVDQGITYWMAEDRNGGWTVGHGVVRCYGPGGVPLTGHGPHPVSIGCAPTVDTPVDFAVRNGAIWGIANFKDLVQNADSAFCCIAPNEGYYEADESLNGPLATDGARELVVSNDAWYVCAWHEPEPGQRQGRVLALGPNNNLLWQTDLPLPQYGEVRNIALFHDSIAAVGFPYVFWLRPTNGTHSSTTELYTGPPGHGKLVANGDELYWAVNTGGATRYGKTDVNGDPVWSGTGPDLRINAIALDDTGALWIGGETPSGGLLVRVAPDGTFGGAYPQYATVTDVETDGDRVLWTGRTFPQQPHTYLIVGRNP